MSEPDAGARLVTVLSQLYGLTVAAPFALGHPVAPGAPADIRVTVDDRLLDLVGHGVPEGRVVASMVRERTLYTLVDRGEAGHLFRFHGFADVVLDLDGGICCRLVDGAQPEMLPVILAGNVLAAVLLLRGELTLHASAVERDGRAVALVASSGGGKSTLAAMMCTAGAQLVTDDVLRVEIDGDDARCHRGAGILRLRPGSKALAAGAVGSDARSADGRHLLGMPSTTHATMRLDAIVIPRLGTPEQALERSDLAAKASLFALLQHPRVEGWVDPLTSASHFAKLVRLVERVPVAYLDVPWGVATDPRWFERLGAMVFAASAG